MEHSRLASLGFEASWTAGPAAAPSPIYGVADFLLRDPFPGGGGGVLTANTAVEPCRMVRCVHAQASAARCLVHGYQHASHIPARQRQ